MNKLFKVVLSIPCMGRYSKYVEINNVPEDLPEEYKDTLKYAAISKLKNIFNHKHFINVYNVHDDCKSLINIRKIDRLNILDIKAV